MHIPLSSSNSLSVLATHLALIAFLSIYLQETGVYADVTVSTFSGTGEIGSANGNKPTATFNGPYSLVFDIPGNLYISDRLNHVIRRIAPNGTVTTIAGDGTPSYADGLVSRACFNMPAGIDVDWQGNIYVADGYNHRIRMITSDGVVSTLAGNGKAGYADGIGTDTMFNLPSDVVVDYKTGNIYVTDTLNHLVRMIAPNGVVSTVAGNGAGRSVDGIAKSASFYRPSSIDMDAIGNLYITDQYGHKIRKVRPDGAVLTISGTGTAGYLDGVSKLSMFTYPTGLVVDAAGNVYVADRMNHVVRVIAPNGITSTVAGTGNTGSADGPGSFATFDQPIGVALDAKGNLFVVDYTNNNIRMITGLATAYTGTFLTQKSGAATPTPTTTSASYTSASTHTSRMMVVTVAVGCVSAWISMLMMSL